VEVGKRSVVDLDILTGRVKGSNLKRSGNGNSVKVYFAGVRQYAVNITVTCEAEESGLEDSSNDNVVEIYNGQSSGINMDNSKVVGGSLEIVECRVCFSAWSFRYSA